MRQQPASLRIAALPQRSKPRFISALQESKYFRVIAVLLISIALGVQVRADDDRAGLNSKPYAHKASVTTLNALGAGEPQDVIVVFDDQPIQSEAATMRTVNPDSVNLQTLQNFKQHALRRLKQDVLSALSVAEANPVRDYSHLPMTSLRVDNLQALNRLLDDPRVTRIYENRENRMHLSETLPLIHQPQANAAGYLGGGTVAVLDSGVDYTNAAFGTCSAPGDTGCSVVYAQDFAPEDGVLDADSHGTNVAATVLGVASQARIAALDVFDGPSASDAWILAAINWAVANQQTYDIVALNLSLGSNIHWAAECVESPYTQAFAAARATGILPIVSAGNEANKQGISYPACTPGALRVGAVYDDVLGPVQWSNCSDFATDADQVTCFSNSAPILTLLAPGALTTAADITMGGTSQAAPHVAGAVAVLRKAFPQESIEQTVDRMTHSGLPVRDSTNGLIHPRLDLVAALGSVGR